MNGLKTTGSLCVILTFHDQIKQLIKHHLGIFCLAQRMIKSNIFLFLRTVFMAFISR